MPLQKCLWSGKAQEMSCGALCYSREDSWGSMHYLTQKCLWPQCRLLGKQRGGTVCEAKEDPRPDASLPSCAQGYCSVNAWIPNFLLLHDSMVLQTVRKKHQAQLYIKPDGPGHQKPMSHYISLAVRPSKSSCSTIRVQLSPAQPQVPPPTPGENGDDVRPDAALG